MSDTSRPAPHNRVTVVEEGSELKGTLTSSCPIEVRGRVEGEIETPSLTVGASGAVHGRVKVGRVRSEGELSGEFDADSVELAGVVRDNTVIRARTLDVKLASSKGKLQVIFGECELSVGDEPTAADHLERPASPVESAFAQARPLPAFADDADDVATVTPPPAAPAEPGEKRGEDEAASATEADGSEQAADAALHDGDGDGKRKRKRKNGQRDEQSWSQPPSQPPPAS
jgi:cytoskeletal protein CcmA (bactofilin family)